MEEQIKELNDLKLKITANLKEWVQDKSIPLDKRWEVFFKSDLGKHESSYEDFVNFNVDDYCDTHNRYETIDLQNVAEWGIKALETDESYNAFREDVLSKFIKSFRFDW